MTEEHTDGWLHHDREPIPKRDPEKRKADFDELWDESWDEDQLRSQGERCMTCGTPSCMSGCPIGNIMPEFNDLVYRDDWKPALERLHATNNFPEFTGYNCPAPCENACTLAYNDDPVTIKSIERAIVDKGWEEGWIQPDPPAQRTDDDVAIVGSGPTGLAAAQQLNRAGHHVTVYERDPEPGGLMRYGIPDAKFSKEKVERRIDQLREEGINFETNTEIGDDVPAEALADDYDATLIAVGAQSPMDLPIEGRGLDGIHFAMEYLPQGNPQQRREGVEADIDADGKTVVVLGGGATGADCVGTAHRQGAEEVIQVELLPKPPAERPPESHWPEQPETYVKRYAQKEGGCEEYCVDTNAFVDTDGDGSVDALAADRIEWEQTEDGFEKHVLESDLEIAADLVIVAIGFEGPEETPFDPLDIEMGEGGAFEIDDSHMTSVDGVFAAGDAATGPSLIVWAIGEGRDAARDIDLYLTGETGLPPSLDTPNQPVIQRR
jgi:glutamate synthase (NADPH/NADH) small chain